VVNPTDLASLRIDRTARTRPRAPLWRRWYVWVAAVAVLALTLFVLSRLGGPLTVQTTQAEARGGGAGGSGLTANGYVVARTKASISSKIAGRLARLAVEEGDRVAKGEVIAWLDDAEYTAAVRQAESNVLNAEAGAIEAEARRAQAGRDLERARELFADSLVSRQSVQDAETALDAAEAQVRAATARTEATRAALGVARANLENTRIRAPFAGTVLRKDAEVGEVVAPSVAGTGLTRGAVVTMADLTTLEVEVDVNEAYIGDVRQDQPATIALDAYPTVSYPGHVRQILPTADRQKATVLVRVAFDSADARVLPEMGGRVVFLAENDTAATAPRVFVAAAAVRNVGGTDYAWIVTDGTVTRRALEAGPVSSGQREVRAGLRGGETLVLEPPPDLADGARVRVQPPAR
jgi:RND family efflux transporter MFP subunit